MLYNVGCTCNFVYIKGHGWVGWGCTYTLSCRCTCIYLCLIPVSFKFLYPFLPVFTCVYLYLSVFYLYLLVFTYIYLCLPVLKCIYLCLPMPPVFTCLYLSLPVFTCRIVWGAWTWQRTGRRMTSRECPLLRMSTSPVTRRVPAPGIPVIPVTPASETPEVS